MKSKIAALLLCLQANTWAQDLSASFPQGKGSHYKMQMQAGGTPMNVAIYVAASSQKAVHIEYFIETAQSLLPVQMWQQFEIQVDPGKPAQILSGYLQTKELKAPEKMPVEYLRGFNGVQVNDFLFASKEALGKHKVGEETISIPAGSARTTHYRTANNGQTVDYWISDEAKPLGLVRLVSQNPNDKNQNYSLEIINLMSNVKAHIDPSKAVPLSTVGKAFMMKPESFR